MLPLPDSWLYAHVCKRDDDRDELDDLLPNPQLRVRERDADCDELEVFVTLANQSCSRYAMLKVVKQRVEPDSDNLKPWLGDVLHAGPWPTC